MAPTKANARYAVTTLSLPTKVMGECSLVHVAARFNQQANRSFPPEKVSAAATRAGDVVKE
jgi:hypothetical protein